MVRERTEYYADVLCCTVRHAQAKWRPSMAVCSGKMSSRTSRVDVGTPMREVNLRKRGEIELGRPAMHAHCSIQLFAVDWPIQ